MRAILFLTTDFEEIEAIGTIDILRRGGVQVKTASVTGDRNVVGSHGISVLSDGLFHDLINDEYEMLIIPGGSGALALKTNDELKRFVSEFYQDGKYIAAICAAPTVLGAYGLLTGKKACCYPGLEDGLLGAEVSSELVCVDGKIITGKGPAAVFEFGLKLVEILMGKEAAQKVKSGMLY